MKSINSRLQNAIIDITAHAFRNTNVSVKEIKDWVTRAYVFEQIDDYPTSGFEDGDHNLYSDEGSLLELPVLRVYLDQDILNNENSPFHPYQVSAVTNLLDGLFRDAWSTNCCLGTDPICVEIHESSLRWLHETIGEDYVAYGLSQKFNTQAKKREWIQALPVPQEIRNHALKKFGLEPNIKL